MTSKPLEDQPQESEWQRKRKIVHTLSALLKCILWNSTWPEAYWMKLYPRALRKSGAFVVDDEHKKVWGIYFNVLSTKYAYFIHAADVYSIHLWLRLWEVECRAKHWLASNNNKGHKPPVLLLEVELGRMELCACLLAFVCNIRSDQIGLCFFLIDLHANAKRTPFFL